MTSLITTLPATFPNAKTRNLCKEYGLHQTDSPYLPTVAHEKPIMNTRDLCKEAGLHQATIPYLPPSNPNGPSIKINPDGADFALEKNAILKEQKQELMKYIESQKTSAINHCIIYQNELLEQQNELPNEDERIMRSELTKNDVIDYIAKKTYNPIIYYALSYTGLLYMDYFSIPLLEDYNSNMHIDPMLEST